MIQQHKLSLSNLSNQPVDRTICYHLFSWLLEQVSPEEAQWIHDCELPVLSQYYCRGIWTVNLLCQKTVELFSGILSSIQEVNLRHQRIQILSRERTTFDTPERIFQAGRMMASRRVEVHFLTPAAFKQAGRYAIFPSEALLIRSLVSKWNIVFPQYEIDDEDFLQQLRNGVHLVDYNLRTGRFYLKGARIPCFYGKTVLESKLPVVVQELWYALLFFSQFCGIGMKTSLGMGGTEVHSIDNYGGKICD